MNRRTSMFKAKNILAIILGAGIFLFGIFF